MTNPFAGELNPLDVTVTADVIGSRGDSVVLRAIVEDGTAADGGEIEVEISGSAVAAYGMEACIDELENALNRTLRPAFRLSAALAIGAQGTFLIVISAGTGPQVLIPEAGRRAA